MPSLLNGHRMRNQMISVMFSTILTVPRRSCPISGSRRKEGLSSWASKGHWRSSLVERVDGCWKVVTIRPSTSWSRKSRHEPQEVLTYYWCLFSECFLSISHWLSSMHIHIQTLHTPKRTSEATPDGTASLQPQCWAWNSLQTCFGYAVANCLFVRWRNIFEVRNKQPINISIHQTHP